MTIFSVMTALANAHGAINLAQGFPDFGMDAELADLLQQAARDGHNQYAAMQGLPLLRNTLSAYLHTRFGAAIHADTQLTITPGATYGIYCALSITLRPGDECIVLEPAYDSYIPNILACRAVPVTVPLLADTFLPDWPRIADAITPRTRAIIINSPHNPSGAVWRSSDLDRLAELVRGKNITIVSDEVYEQLVFDGAHHHSVLAHPELSQQSFAVFSFGKVLMNTGWKVGYVVAPPRLTTSFQSLHQYLAFSVNTPAQWALAQYLERHPHLNVALDMQARRDLFYTLMSGGPLELLPPAAGSFFQLARYPQGAGVTDRSYAEAQCINGGVAAIPVSSFYHEKHPTGLLRFCFAKQESTLKAAAEKLRSYSSS